jgi:hypothetical protein
MLFLVNIRSAEDHLAFDSSPHHEMLLDKAQSELGKKNLNCIFT